MDMFLQLPIERWNTAAGLAQRLVLGILFAIWILGLVKLIRGYLAARERARIAQAELFRQGMTKAAEQGAQAAIAIDNVRLAALALGTSMANAFRSVARDPKDGANRSG